MKYITSLLLLLSCSLYAQDYLLKSRVHQVKVTPETMEIKIKTGNNNWEDISAPQKKSPVDIIQSSSNGLTWFNREYMATFTLTQTNNRIDLTIKNPEKNQIVFPKIESSNRTEALIWPAFDGLWLPFKSSKGISFFKNNELPLNRNSFWGINLKNKTLTFMQESPIRTFHYTSKGETVIEFFQNTKILQISIILTNSPSPIEPALIYKKLSGKKTQLSRSIPNDFLGAPVIFMKGKEYLTADDIKIDLLRDLCRHIVAESRLVTTPSFKLKRAILAMKEWSYITDGAKSKNPTKNDAVRVAKSLSKVIGAPNFYSESIIDNSRYLYNSFKDYLYPVETWGSGESLGVLTRLKELKIDKSIIITEHTMSNEMKSHTSLLGYISNIKERIKGIPENIKENYIIDRSLQLPLLNAVYRENYLTVSAYQDIDNRKTQLLKQLLYMQAPLFPMDSNSRREEHLIIRENYDVFSELHQKYGSSPMLGFDFLSGSGLIQRATYLGGLTVVANFSKIECTYMDNVIPPESVLIKTPEELIIY